MSLIIKGMSLPSECSECLFSCYDISVGEPAQCIILGERSARYSRLKNCPLSELPTPHGRLIDADRFLDWLKEFHPNDVVIMSGVKNARTVIEAEASE